MAVLGGDGGVRRVEDVGGDGEEDVERLDRLRLGALGEDLRGRQRSYPPSRVTSASSTDRKTQGRRTVEDRLPLCR